MRIAKRILITVLLAFGLIIVTGVLIGVLLGVYVALNPATTLRPPELYTTIGYIQMSVGGIGLILGCIGILPGTEFPK